MKTFTIKLASSRPGNRYTSVVAEKVLHIDDADLVEQDTRCYIYLEGGERIACAEARSIVILRYEICYLGKQIINDSMRLKS